MRVVQLNKQYFPDIGGIESAVRDIAEGLSALDKEVISEVFVCRKKGIGYTEYVNGVKVRRASSLGTLLSLPIAPLYPLQVRAELKNADAVILHEPFPLGDAGLLLSGYEGRTALFWHSDIVRQKKMKRILMPVMREVLRRADLIFVATENLVKSSELLSEYEGKCVIVPFGVDIGDVRAADGFLSRYSNGGSADGAENALPSAARVKKALFVGRLVYYKGADLLVEAFCGVNGAELFIVGQGPLEYELKMRVKRYGAWNKIHFLGALSDDDLKRAFADCDYLVFPSTENSEAFGIVQLEAMIQGKPVINTNLPTGVPFVSLDGVSGITVSPRDAGELRAAIQKLTDDDDLRERLGCGAKRRAIEFFDKKAFCAKIYEHLVKRK
jgi:rhamnosyl/mannosyltransferase